MAPLTGIRVAGVEFDRVWDGGKEITEVEARTGLLSRLMQALDVKEH
jgi:hypothetical protein